MKEKKAALARVVTPEIVSEVPTTRPADMNALLDRLVMQRVAEVFAKRDGFILEPWFQTKSVAKEIRKLQTVQDRNAKALYFERYGCIHCHTQKHRHASSGLCIACYRLIAERLKTCARNLTAAAQEEKRTPRDLGALAENCLRPLRADKAKE